MGKSIPIDLNPSRAVEIDGALVASGLGLGLADFRQLMEHRKITVLCELGIGEDAGLYRASFYHEGKRVRLVVGGDGKLVSEKITDATPAAIQIFPDTFSDAECREVPVAKRAFDAMMDMRKIDIATIEAARGG